MVSCTSTLYYVVNLDETRSRSGGIKVGEDGVITQIAQRAKYYFGLLEGVDGGDGAQVPNGATFYCIGGILSHMKTKLNPLLNYSGFYRGHNLDWWREHTREILAPSILNFDPEAANELVGQFRDIAQADEAECKTRHSPYMLKDAVCASFSLLPVYWISHTHAHHTHTKEPRRVTCTQKHTAHKKRYFIILAFLHISIFKCMLFSHMYKVLVQRFLP